MNKSICLFAVFASIMVAGCASTSTGVNPTTPQVSAPESTSTAQVVSKKDEDNKEGMVDMVVRKLEEAKTAALKYKEQADKYYDEAVVKYHQVKDSLEK